MTLGEFAAWASVDDDLLEVMLFGVPTFLLEGAANMQPIDAFELYRLGVALTELRRLVDSDRPPGGLLAKLAFVVLGGIESIVPLPHSHEHIQKLGEEIRRMMDLANTPEAIPPDDCAILSRMISTLTHFLRAELPRLPIYYVRTRLGYDTEKLLKEAECLLPDAAAKALPAEALRDVREAGRCLAFGLWTAVAFHALRATEIVMIELIVRLGGNLPAEGSRTWANLNRALNETNRAKPRLLGRLSRLKDLERNTLMHAGRFLDEAECADVFDYTKTAMVPMLMHLAELGDKG